MSICDHFLVLIEKYTLGRSCACIQELEDMTELSLTVCFTHRKVLYRCL